MSFFVGLKQIQSDMLVFQQMFGGFSMTFAIEESGSGLLLSSIRTAFLIS